LNVLLWDKAVSFLEGGSQEELQMEQLRGDIRRQFPTTVTTALSMVLGRNGSVASPALYEIQVRNRSGEPVPRADVLLVGLDGVFLRSTTNPAGRATFGPTPLGDVAAFVAHPQYHGACLHANGPSVDVNLNSQDGVGSMIATSGWISVSGLVGQVSLIHDAQRRTYIYGENVAIDGGAQQPVNVALGTKTELKGTDGTTVSIVPKAIRGPCFLLDVVEQTAVG
jgi:hypothetical protein